LYANESGAGPKCTEWLDGGYFTVATVTGRYIQQQNMRHYMTNERYIQTDEAEDVAGSIRHVLRCADFVNEDPQAWK